MFYGNMDASVLPDTLIYMFYSFVNTNIYFRQIHQQIVSYVLIQYYDKGFGKLCSVVVVVFIDHVAVYYTIQLIDMQLGGNCCIINTCIIKMFSLI